MGFVNVQSAPPAGFSDAFGRPLGSLRLSVTDRCNLRCRYCMPEEEYIWLERNAILNFEEIAALAAVFVDLGVDRLRLTGGEPLMRRDLPELVRMLRRLGPSPDSGNARDSARRPLDLALTTNGMLLADHASVLREAGLDRITVSLDTLRPERFRVFARRDGVQQVRAGIEAARRAEFRKLKINSVVIRGFNDDELADLIDYGRSSGAEIRFIEYMDVGGATHWSADQVVSREEILDRLAGVFGKVREVAREGPSGSAAPADQFELGDGTRFGIIASTTRPFCALCDRARLTPDGVFLLCLYARQGLDLKTPLRRGARREELHAMIAEAWRARRDRGAEDRLRVRSRGPLVSVETLRRDPHLEMHTRGG